MARRLYQDTDTLNREEVIDGLMKESEYADRFTRCRGTP
jgi:hypothetical protein